jgi:cysteine desulfuration protein SufE
MSLIQKQRELLAKLAAIQNAQERFSFIVEQGKRQPALDASLKTDVHRVEGCLSKLWLTSEFKDGKCYFQADADSVIVKSMAAMLCDFYSSHRPEEIVSIDPSFLGQVGITQHLTPNRRNALSRVWDKIRDFAAARLPNAGAFSP